MTPSLLPTTPSGASSGAELVTTDGRLLPLVGAELRGEAQGGLARLVLVQRFANHYAEVLNVTYRMPLPADGAISGYAFEIGERVITGVIDRKAAARERFERAIADGRTAALLEQERADIFTQQIGNIPPGETIVARITIDQRLVWLPEGEWELRFPTVIGPRYIGSADTVEDVRATHVKVTDKPLPVRIQLAVAVRDTLAGRPSSPTHRLAVTGDSIALAEGARLDRDLVVRWSVAQPTVGLSLATARPATGPGSGDAYGLVTIVPPSPTAKAIAVPRDLIVLLDTSGSMGGGPLDKAKQVVAMMIDSLDERDRFELVEFSDEPSRYLAEPEAATAQAKQRAIQWVRSREASGGTEMRTAVIEALATLRIGAQRQVIVVTDGMVGGEQQILEVLHRRLPASCRLHVLGVGSSVNRSIAIALSRAGRGVEVIVGVDEDAERGAKRLLDRTRSPILTNVELGGSAVLRHAPEKIPDVFAGAPLVAAVALRAAGGELVVRGDLAGERWEQTLRVPARQPGEGNQAIAALYGRERVADVESHAMFESIDGEIEDLGLTFQIATRRTSWVAIDESRRVTGPKRDVLVPQELPYGTRAGAFGLRGSMMAGGMFKQRVPGRELEGDATPLGGPSFDVGESLGEAPHDIDASVGDASFAPVGAPSYAKEVDAKLEAELEGDRDYADEEFGAEAGTGQFDAPREVANKPAEPPAPAAPRQPSTGANKLVLHSMSEPPGYRERQQAKDEAGRDAPKGGAARDGKPAPAAKPVAPKQRARRFGLVIAALLAILAALLWWWLA